MVSMVNYGQIIVTLKYYSQINTDSHMASTGHQGAVSQESTGQLTLSGVQSISVESEESPHQTVQQDDEMKPPAENVFSIYKNSLQLFSL